MKYTLTIRIDPPGPFGVPQDSVTVFPAAPGTITGPTIHTDTGTLVGYGTLSRYRSEDEAIRLQLKTRRGNIRISDNFAFIEVEAPTPEAARAVCVALADRFLQHLALNTGQLFTFKPLIFEGEDRSLHPLPRSVDLGGFTSYDLHTLADHLRNAAEQTAIDDRKLVLATDYFQQALLLFTSRRSIADPMLRQHSMLISAAFLNLWKAISTVVGDPSVDSDYQSRYKAIGLDHDFFKNKIEKVRELRNNLDVAHYSLKDEDVAAVERSFEEATQVALDVIRAYRSSLIAA